MLFYVVDISIRSGIGARIIPVQCRVEAACQKSGADSTGCSGNQGALQVGSLATSALATGVSWLYVNYGNWWR